MFLRLFTDLRTAKVPVTLREYLTLLEGVEADLAEHRVDEFYYLARATLVKDERHLDKFDRVFAQVFKGMETLQQAIEEAGIPEEWLRKLAEKFLTDEEKAQIDAMGWEKLWETLKQRLEEQKGRHQGGSKWIGTAGTSPFGAYGYNPEGVRIGRHESRNRRAVKVWDKREFKDYDDNEELSPRNIQVALKRLRKFARTGAADQLDLDDTIRATAANAGYLDLKMVAERHNAVKVLLLMDVGGSMDEHIHRVEQLFAAAKTEFKHLQFYYFHNCVYDFVWNKNARRFAEKISTHDLIRTYNKDYKLIFVGDATMSPYEILQPYGSVEWSNEEPGAVWLQRLIEAFPKFVWLNPEPTGIWEYRQSLQLIQQILGPERMYPLTLQGLEGAMKALSK